VGDFDPAQVKRWVAKYFGDLPGGGKVSRPRVDPVSMPSERRMVFEDRVQVPRLYLAWNAPGQDSRDGEALDLLVGILSGPRTARLTRALVYDQQSAASLSAHYEENEQYGQIVISITPRPGHTLTELEAGADSVLARLKADGPSEDEIARAVAGAEFGFVHGLESNLGKAEMLAAGQVFHHDPAYGTARVARLRSVTADDIRRVANRYLGSERAVLSIVPAGQPGDASRPEESVKVTVAPDGGHYIMETR